MESLWMLSRWIGRRRDEDGGESKQLSGEERRWHRREQADVGAVSGRWKE